MTGFDLSAPSWDSWFNNTCQLREVVEILQSGLTNSALVPASGVPDSIACNVQPSGGRQVQLGPQQFELSSHLVFLRGFFPSVISTMTALVDGVTHEILLVEDDGANCCTTLVTRSA